MIVGFLCSPIKWLAVLGLADYGLWYMPYLILKDENKHKRFNDFFNAHGYAASTRDKTKLLRIYIRERNYEYTELCTTRVMLSISRPKLLYAVCFDKEGNRFLVYDQTGKGKNIKVLPFHERRVYVTGHTKEGEDMEVEFEIIRNDYPYP